MGAKVGAAAGVVRDADVARDRGEAEALVVAEMDDLAFELGERVEG